MTNEDAAELIRTRRPHEIVRDAWEFWEIFHYVWGETRRETIDYREVLKPLIQGMQYWLENNVKEVKD